MAAEVFGEACRVDRRGGHDHPQLGPLRDQLIEVAQQKIDVERTFVRFIDNDRVVSLELPIRLRLGHQDAVGHHFDVRLGPRAVMKPNFVADRFAQWPAQLFGQPGRNTPGRNPPRLRVPDPSPQPPPGREADLGQLGRLARTGFAAHHDHPVFADRGRDLFASGKNGQVLFKPHRRDVRRPLRSAAIPIAARPPPVA